MKALFLVLLLFVSSNSFAQVRTITGRILDSETLKPIKDVGVIIPHTKKSTYTNYRGYFQVEVNDSEGELQISHIGYGISKISIPENDQFAVSITQIISYLDSLNIELYPRTIPDEKTVGKPLVSEDILSKSTKNASYISGWDGFYSQLGNKIVHPNKFVSQPFSADVQFTISDKGQIENILVNSRLDVNKNVIADALHNIKMWDAALQNNNPVSQTFNMKIYWSFDSPSNDFYSVLDKMPNYKGGLTKFYKYVQQNMVYPQTARKQGIEGKVFVLFIVDEVGNILDVKTIQGIGGDCDKEAERVIKNAKNWEAGLYDNKPVKVKMILPITFKLN